MVSILRESRSPLRSSILHAWVYNMLRGNHLIYMAAFLSFASIKRSPVARRCDNSIVSEEVAEHVEQSTTAFAVAALATSTGGRALVVVVATPWIGGFSPWV